MLVSKLHPVREEWVQFFFARNLAFIFFQSQKDRGGISLDNSWRITVGHRMHNSCCACVYQLLCKRTTAVVRPEILTTSTTYPISPNNISYLSQQLILSLPTTRRGWIIILWHTLLDSGNMVKLVISNIKNVRKFVSLLVFLVLLPHNYGLKCGKCGELHKRDTKNV